MSEVEGMHIRGIAFTALVFAAAAGLAGCSLFPEEDEPIEAPFAKPVEAKIVAVEAKKSDIVRRELGSGRFEPVLYTPHQFTEAGGRIEQVLVNAGDTVKKGDVLIRLDMEGLDIELLQRKLELERGRVAFKEAVNGGNADYIRIADLELQLAKLLLDKVESKVNERELRSEIDGVVTFVDNVEPGSYVDRFRRLVVVSDPSKLRLAYTVTDVTNQNDIAVGMKAEIEIDGRIYTGTIVQTPSSAPQTDNEQLRKLYQRTLYIEPDELPAGVQMGNTAIVNIVLAEKRDAVVIPRSALRTHFERRYVQLKEGESRREVDVEVGLETPTEVEIVKGVEVGQLVILP